MQLSSKNTHSRRFSQQTDVSDEEILQHLPNKNMTLSIAAITKLLSDRGTNNLGFFEKKYMFDPIGQAAHSR